jgi:hypothetical protein
VPRSTYHVSDGSLDRTTSTTLTRLLRRLPHTLLTIQHTISLFRTRSFALGVWVSIRERTKGYYHRTYWELTALVSGLHSNGGSGATGCTGGRVTSFLPQYLPIQMRCVTQHHRISSDPTPYLHAPHVERRFEACLPGLNWVVCLVELRGARLSHNF